MSFTYEGDIGLATQWLPFAVTQQNTLIANGVRSVNVSPLDGVMIFISTKPNHIHIIAGGGRYFFISYDEASYLTHAGERPVANQESGEATKQAFIKADITALTIAAPRSDRIAWYSKVGSDSYTVLSGYGTQYMINRFPHYSMNSSDIYNGYLELYKNGRKVKTASFHGLNGFLIDNELVAVDTDGAITYEKEGATVSTDTTVPLPSLATAADMIDRGGGIWNGEAYTFVYVSHELQDPDIKHACNWQINKDATKAVSVSYINYEATYEARQDSDNELLFDSVLVDIVPYLIEMDISVTRNGDGVPTVRFDFAKETIMSYAVTKQFLIAADFYYYAPKDEANQQAYEPDEGEMVMALVEHFNYHHDGRLYEGLGDNSTDSTLIIKSKENEYIRDQYCFNTDVTTLSGKGNNRFRGNVSAIDLRTMTYIVSFIDRGIAEDFLGTKIVFRGKVVFNKALTSEGYATKSNVTDYSLPAITEINGPNWYFGFQFSFKLDGKIAANPFEDYLFTFLKTRDYAFDLFIYFGTIDDEEEYMPAFNYHANSSGVELSSLPCTANVLVI